MRIALVVAASAIATAQAADVRVLVTGEVAPGVYGRVDIGGAPPPPVVVATPVIIQKVKSPPPPIYLHVPPGHQKKWSKHCHRYNACGVPVYFVRSAEYEPGYKHPGKGAEKSAGKGKGKGKDG